MTIANIRCFNEAARCENFTQAARNLFMTQPAMSKQVALVEQEVGVPLFFRAGRGVKLTPSGRRLYESLKDLPGLTEQAVEEARALGRGFSGRLLIGMLEGQDINNVILPRLRDFGERYPELDVHLERNSFRNLRTGLANGHYDLIVTLSFELEQIENASSAIVLSQQGGFAINKNHSMAAWKNLTLDMLKGADFLAISPEESPNGYELLFKQCRLHGFEPMVTRTLSSLESLLLGVEAGMGVAMLDRNTRLEHNSEVRIVTIENSDYSHVVAVWHNENQNPAVANLGAALAGQ